MSGCSLESPNRRVISHFFGRNKKETRAIPDECWAKYCRQHYQRCRYRMPAEQFAALQMELVEETVQKLQQWGGVRDWSIAIRKRAAEQMAEEDAAKTAATASDEENRSVMRGCRERVIARRTGKNKSFEDVFALITAVDKYSKDNKCEALEFEVVPQYRPGVLETRAPTQKRTRAPSAAQSRPSTSAASPCSKCVTSQRSTLLRLTAAKALELDFNGTSADEKGNSYPRHSDCLSSLCVFALRLLLQAD